MANKASKTFAIDTGDLDRLSRGLALLTSTQQRAIMRRALQAGSTPTLKAFRANVRNHDGEYSEDVMKTAVMRKAKTSRRTGRSYILIGMNKRVAEVVEVVYRRPNGGTVKKKVTRKPSRYFHLVEFGTSKSRAYPMLRPAVDSTKAAAELRTKDFFRRGIEAALHRLVARGIKKSEQAAALLEEVD